MKQIIGHIGIGIAILLAFACVALPACGSSRQRESLLPNVKTVPRKACVNIIHHPKTHKTTRRRYACSDYHPVPPSG
jgi:hypothetical protein